MGMCPWKFFVFFMSLYFLSYVYQMTDSLNYDF